jgi:hypothetical protein
MPAAERRDTKKRKSRTPAAPETPILVSTAQAIGNVAGKIAALAGAKPDALPRAKPKRRKLPAQQKARLPRGQKKARQRATVGKKG